MNHTPSGSLLLSKAIPGFINYKTAEGLALRTIDSHERLLNKWLEHIGDQEIGKITAQDVVAYLSWLRNEYTPRRYNGKTHPLSPKSLRNVWVTLSSFYSWAAQELGVTQIMKSVPAPRIKKTPIEPLTQEEVQHMLKACVYSREARPRNRRSFTMRLRFSHRDQAIILTLIDTGLRAMELCKLLIGSIDLKTGRVEVKHGVIGGAKGGKGRTVYLGKTTRKAVWRYLVTWSQHSRIPASLQVEGEKSMPLEVEQTLFRVAQEALSNVARHSRASAVNVTLASTSSQVTLCISDNGVGFDLSATHNGFSLESMHDRMTAILGNLVIQAAPNDGSTITASVQFESQVFK